jgi:phage major head subunit gpT-like protein
MAINRSQIANLLKPGLAAITGKYKEIPTQWTQVFQRATSKMANEVGVEMRYMGLAQLKPEGGTTVFDNSAGQRYTYNIQNINLGLGFAITREALDDNLYKDKFNPQAIGLGRSFAQTWEILHANLFNTATTYNASVVGDGVALAATNHPIDGGTAANTPATPLNLNESAIETALTTIRAFPDQAGLKSLLRGRKLVVPPALQWTAERLTKTELRTNTANNDVSAIVSSGALPEGYQVMDFLTSTLAWGIETSVEDSGLMHFDRTPYEMDLQVDPTTGNLLCIGYERAGIGYFDWRALWWTVPTS